MKYIWLPLLCILPTVARAAPPSTSDSLHVLYSLLVSQRDPNPQQATKQEPDDDSGYELSQALMQWNPGEDLDELRQAFSLPNLREVARWEAYLPVTGGGAGGEVTIGRESWSFDFSLIPKSNTIWKIDAQVFRNGELVSSPRIHTLIDERITVSTSNLESGTTVFIIMDVRQSAEGLHPQPPGQK